jgi:hypothetical protein
MATRTCRICGRDCLPERYLTEGRCPMCAIYWRRHGAERPPQPSGDLKRPGLQACSHCGRLAPRRSQGRCLACYQYGRRTGQERPARLWERHGG